MACWKKCLREDKLLDFGGEKRAIPRYEERKKQQPE